MNVYVYVYRIVQYMHKYMHARIYRKYEPFLSPLPSKTQSSH